MEEKSTFRKILGVALMVAAVIGLYLIGKALGIDVVGEFAPWLAALIIGWVIYLAQKWFGVKLDILNNDYVKQKVIDGIVWAEGKAVEAFKIDRMVTAGKDKLKWATAQIMTALPKVTEEEARRLIENYFPLIRPKIEEMWFKLADEMKKKEEIRKDCEIDA